MVNMSVPYRGPDGMSQQLLTELQARFGARAQNKGFVTGYMDAARAGQNGGHFADEYGITHAIDIGVDIESDGTGLLPADALWVAEHIRALGAAGVHPVSREGYLIHDMSTTTTPAPKIAGAYNGWKWAPYTGASPHSDHIHVTTGGDQQWGEAPRLAPAVYNSRAAWGITEGGSGMAMRPVPEMYPVTQGFYADATAYNYGKGHGAVDYGVPIGTPLVAPEDGVVVFDGWAWDLPGGTYDWAARLYQIKPARGDTRTGGGIMTIIRNAAGSHWVIAHANRSLLNTGDRVRKGQLIQETGTTGSSTGPHSHVSLVAPNPDWSNGYFGAIDPAPYIGDPYQPLTAVSWQGAPTTGVGAATTTKKDWFDMATEADLRRIVAEESKKVLITELTYPRSKKGGAGGKVSIQDEILHLASHFGEIQGNLRAIITAVSPATLEAVIRENITPDTQVDPAELADLLAPALLRHILTPTQNGA